jgi:hypothetical protein
MPLTPVTACFIAIDPLTAVGAGTTGAGTPLATLRIVAFVASICSAGVYFLIGISMHRSMVRNFDMIIRKQTA